MSCYFCEKKVLDIVAIMHSDSTTFDRSTVQFYDLMMSCTTRVTMDVDNTIYGTLTLRDLTH